MLCGSMRPRSGPGVVDRLCPSIRSMTNVMSRAWSTLSASRELPLLSFLVVGNVGAATTYPALAHASSRSASELGSPSSPCATTTSGSGPVTPVGYRTWVGTTRHDRSARCGVAGVERRGSMSVTSMRVSAGAMSRSVEAGCGGASRQRASEFRGLARVRDAGARAPRAAEAFGCRSPQPTTTKVAMEMLPTQARARVPWRRNGCER